jgi:L-ascorbate metabolism protein UlaG (beta-lactamase superfamily)
MRLLKYGHSCVTLDDGNGLLVIDPGTMSNAAEALKGAGGILITHEHGDHVDVGAVRAAAADNSDLQIWAPQSVAAMLADLGDRVVTVTAGEEFSAVGFAIKAFGGQHALIHSSIAVCQNLGYVIDERIYHPGDSYVVPPVAVDTLLVPLSSPWGKLGETLDFVIAVRARAVHQIHDALLSEIGCKAFEGHVARVGAEFGSTFSHLSTGDGVDI